MDIWQTASPDHPAGTGWIGRWLDANGRDPLDGRVAGAGAAADAGGRDHRGRRAAAARARPADRAARRRRSRRSGRPSAGESPLQAYAARSITDLHRTVDTFGATATLRRRRRRRSRAAAARQRRARRPARRRRRAASRRARPARVYSVSLGGFDTHADERGTQQRLLTEVDQAVSGFLTRMAGTDAGAASC